VLADLAAACNAGLLKEDVFNVYRFSHDLIRETVLKEQNSATLAVMHRRIAEALEQDPRAEEHASELAWHFTRAGRPQQAAIYLALAASQAQAMYAYSDAERYYRELVATLDALARPLDAARAREKWGAVLRISARYDESLAVLERAIAEYTRVGSADEVAHAMAELGLTYASRGLPTEGSQRLSHYLTLPTTQRLSPDVQASLYLALTQLYRIGGRYAEMFAAAESAAALAAQAKNADQRVQAQFERGAALLMLGRNLEGEQALEAALSGVEALGNPTLIARALNTLAVVRDVHGDLDAGRRYVDRALSYAERSADPVLIAFMIYRRATSAFDRGDWETARVDYELALDRVRGVGVSWALPYALRGIGMLNLVTGQEDAAIEALEDGVREAEKLGDLQVMHNLQAALAEGDLLRGDDARVVERLGSLVDDNERQSDVGNVLPPLAFAYDRLGESERADVLIERAVSVARADGAVFELGDALCVRALALARRGHWAEAEAAGLEALALYQQMGMPYKLMRVQYALGIVYVGWGDAARARAHYQAAVELCRALGEQRYRNRAERALKAL
jgi:tetratricopeptide (TPR) repeat protein